MWQTNLNAHIEPVHEKVQYPCNQCGKHLRRKSHLKTHIESVHEKVKYPCNQCGKQLTSKGHLKTHIESVQVKYPYSLIIYVANNLHYRAGWKNILDPFTRKSIIDPGWTRKKAGWVWLTSFNYQPTPGVLIY